MVSCLGQVNDAVAGLPAAATGALGSSCRTGRAGREFVVYLKPADSPLTMAGPGATRESRGGRRAPANGRGFHTGMDAGLTRVSTRAPQRPFTTPEGPGLDPR